MARPSSGPPLKLLIWSAEEGRPPRALKVSLARVHSMSELQQLVAVACEEAGCAEEMGDAPMVMSYLAPSGKWSKVTRSVSVETIKQARTLRLVPH